MVKFFQFNHPQWAFSVCYRVVVAPSYILSQIELEANDMG